ncbi:hypothetical protein F2P81_000633 [Scophthalmus maximus]|uniref:Uncharacterized protein n=1 Tax=Scophthalmus maximus TaxID=52904 RepID=A0A6A4TTP2_SCOMX|nr:hypothetical protein F2P81_000633 [Scophthalmus maximus]
MRVRSSITLSPQLNWERKHGKKEKSECTSSSVLIQRSNDDCRCSSHLCHRPALCWKRVFFVLESETNTKSDRLSYTFGPCIYFCATQHKLQCSSVKPERLRGCSVSNFTVNTGSRVTAKI